VAVARCRGRKKGAQRVAAELTTKPSNAAGRTVATLLAAWIETNEAGWAPATRRDQLSRARMIKADAIGRSRSPGSAWPTWTAGTPVCARPVWGDAGIRNCHLVL